MKKIGVAAVATVLLGAPVLKAEVGNHFQESKREVVNSTKSILDFLDKKKFKFRHEVRSIFGEINSSSSYQDMMVQYSRVSELQKEILLNPNLSDDNRLKISNGLENIKNSIHSLEKGHLLYSLEEGYLREKRDEAKRYAATIGEFQSENRDLRATVTHLQSEVETRSKTGVGTYILGLMTAVASAAAVFFGFKLRKNSKTDKKVVETIKEKIVEVEKHVDAESLILAVTDKLGNIVNSSKKFEELFGSEVRIKFSNNWDQFFSRYFVLEEKTGVQKVFTFLKDPSMVFELSTRVTKDGRVVELKDYDLSKLAGFSTWVEERLSYPICDGTDLLEESISLMTARHGSTYFGVSSNVTSSMNVAFMESEKLCEIYENYLSLGIKLHKFVGSPDSIKIDLKREGDFIIVDSRIISGKSSTNDLVEFSGELAQVNSELTQEYSQVFLEEVTDSEGCHYNFIMKIYDKENLYKNLDEVSHEVSFSA